MSAPAAGPWENWARTERSTPGARVAPTSVAHLQEVLARSTGPVRVMGSSHSWSPLGAGDAGYTLLRLAGPAFEGLHSEVDAEGRVWVGAATTLSALHGLLARARRSLANVGSISAQTVAGITATGTHGAGRCFPCLSAAICGVRFVTAAGEAGEVGDGDPALAHWSLSLGCLGVITALRLRTVALFYVAERSVVIPAEAGPAELVVRVAEEERSRLRHRFSWFAYSSRVRIQSFEPVAAPDVLPEPFEVAPLRARLEGKLLAEGLFEHGLLRATRHFPGLSPAVLRFAGVVHFQDRPEPVVGRLFERINEHGVPKHRETEWAVPLDAAAEAWRTMRARIESRGLPADFLQELRPAKADGLTLSAARERDVCWVSFYQTTAHRWEEGLALAEDVLGGLGGRPHWGKSFEPSTVAARVGAPFAAFEAWRAGLDPTGRFLGPFHRACGFGSTARAAPSA